MPGGSEFFFATVKLEPPVKWPKSVPECEDDMPVEKIKAEWYKEEQQQLIVNQILFVELKL